MADTKDRIQVAANLKPPVRREMLLGREHFAVPAVLVQSQVLRNNLGTTFLPAEDITPEWAELANGAPAVADHPKTSAKSPRVINEMGVGFLFNAEAKDGQLRGEVFIDPGRAGDVPDLRAILEKLENGDAVEVSTGFPVAVEESPGVHNGEEFDRVIHPAGFDHLAVFAKATGACSVADGCGLAQNHEGPCETEDGMDEESVDTIAEKLANRLKGFFAGEEGESPNEGSEADETSEEDDTMNRDTLIAELAESSPLDADALAKLSDCELQALQGAESGEPPEGDSYAWQKANEWRRKYEELEEETRTALKAEEKERANLLDDILYSDNRAYSDAEVRNMGIVELRKLHKTMFPPKADYSGRGGPASNRGSSIDFVRHIMDGPRGKSVLDEQEAS